MRKSLSSVLISMCLFGCGQQSVESTSEIEKPQTAAEIPQSSIYFSSEQAKQNLTFVKNQYLKMIDLVEKQQDLKLAPSCEKEGVVCFPRAEEHDSIYMERPTKWTNGFYPGLLWKVLASKEDIANFSQAEQSKIMDTALFYQNALMPETVRGSTHDLGFILYDSFGEALEVEGLPMQTRKLYQNALVTGQKTLATRYDADKGLIESWDWEPEWLSHHKEGGEIVRTLLSLKEPFTFPVIVDNMMNLEFMFTSEDEAHRDLSFSHAKQTYLNHYFYLEGDVKKEYPIAYHLIDYDTGKPGNWQGIGSISAWARGQAWSLYGYVTVLEAMKDKPTTLVMPDFDAHVDRLIASIEKLLDGDLVPDWDYFAKRPDAAEIAAYHGTDTTRYSRALDLCDFQIADNILPYVGYKPVLVDKSLLSKDSLSFLSDLKSVYGEAFIQGDKVAPCGTKPFERNATHIPKDTSAAALYASALYRLAIHTDKPALKQKASEFADKIMGALTQDYLTSKNKGKDYQLGFALAEATGNLPNASEINTSIVYADFYFLEANILKLKLSKM